jgi:hypothetical protein
MFTRKMVAGTAHEVGVLLVGLLFPGLRKLRYFIISYGASPPWTIN